MTESDLRRWVRKELGDHTYWVEHARGGTVGMADCLIAIDKRLVPLELKVGLLREKESEMWWKMSMRPAQTQIADRLHGQGIGTFVLVGNVYSKDLWLMGDCAFDKVEGEWIRMAGPVLDGRWLLGMLEKWGGL
jgi:hypothetical protein